MLKENNVQYTQNRNGFFFNVSHVPDQLIERMRQFVDFCFENVSKLDAYDKSIIECKLNKNFDEFVSKHTHDTEEHELSQVLLTSKKNKKADNDVSSLVSAAKMDTRVQMLLSHLHKQTENITKRKACTRFITAKKKYSKKAAAPSSTCECDDICLVPDAPCIQNVKYEKDISVVQQ